MITSGIFSNIGDSLTIKLVPINSILNITGYTDSISGLDTGRTMDKWISWSNDDLSYTAEMSLDDPALLLVSFDPTLFYYFKVRYERSGIDATGTLQWNEIELFYKVDPTLVLFLNMANYTAAFGSTSRVEVIDMMVRDFNQFCAENNYQPVFMDVVDDTTIPGLQVYIRNLKNDFDFNELLKTSFGNRFLKMVSGINLNTHKGFESQ